MITPDFQTQYQTNPVFKSVAVGVVVANPMSVNAELSMANILGDGIGQGINLFLNEKSILEYNVTEGLTSATNNPAGSSFLSSYGEVQLGDIVKSIKESDPSLILHNTVFGDKSVEDAGVQTIIGTVSGVITNSGNNVMKQQQPKTEEMPKDLINIIFSAGNSGVWNGTYNSIKKTKQE